MVMFFSLVSFICLGYLFLRLLFSFYGSLLLYNKSKKFTPIHIHGPHSYPLIGCLISFYKNRHRLLDWYSDLLSQSPTQTILVHRLGASRTIVTANPQNVEYMLKTNFVNYPKGKPFTDILGDLLGFGIFNADGQLWRTQRKLASHEFSEKSLSELVIRVLEQEVRNRLVPSLDAAVQTGEVLDLQDILRRFAFDTIWNVSLGMDPCCLDLFKPLPPLLKAFDSASEISAKRGAAPMYAVWKMKRALNIGSEKLLKQAVELVHSIVMQVVQDKKDKIRELEQVGEKSDEDLLSRFLQAGHDEDVVRDLVISFLLAGRDTTSAALTWLFWLLCGHREIEKEVVEEVMLINNGEKKPLDYKELKEMKLIKACLCESMRLYPPVSWDSKHAAEDDVLPDGTPVYKGNRVTYFPYGMGRMEELWGKDRLEFRPDRWFDGSRKESGLLKVVDPFKYPVFQAGPRVCLGKEMAFVEMKYVVASIVKQFEFRPVSTNRPVFIPLLTAHMGGGFKVRVHKRSA